MQIIIIKAKRKIILNEDKIIEEIILNDYLKNKKKSRFNILKNYLQIVILNQNLKIDIKLRMLLEKLMMKWKMHKKNLVSYFKIMKRTITNER